MRATRWRALLVPVVAAATLGIGQAAYAHLPRFVMIKTEAHTHKLRTYGGTVADALADARVTLAGQDRVLPATSTALQTGMTIKIRRAFPVRLFADGHARVYLTAARTVGEFLAETDVPLRPRDRTYPAADAPVWSGATVRIVRIETRITTVVERVPFARIARADPTMPRGLTRVVQDGRPGTRTRRIAVTTADGFVIDRQEVSAAITSPPKDRITHVGSRRVIAARGQFSGREVLHMVATAYAPWCCRGVNDITYTGMKAGFGVVAVDPKVIPLRSVLFIEGYGHAIAGDIGGAIKGYRIDLGFDSTREATRWGRRPVRVYILSEAARTAKQP